VDKNNNKRHITRETLNNQRDHVQNLFTMFSQCSECSESVQTFSEFLAQKLVYSEFLDFAVQSTRK
jgi:hypothetical protein